MSDMCEALDFCLIPQVGIKLGPLPCSAPLQSHFTRTLGSRCLNMTQTHTYRHRHTYTNTHTQARTYKQTNTNIHTHLHRVNYTPHTQNSGCTTTRAGCLDMARSPSNNTSNYYDTSDQSMQKYCETQTIYTYVLQLRR